MWLSVLTGIWTMALDFLSETFHLFVVEVDIGAVMPRKEAISATLSLTLPALFSRFLL